MAVKLLKAGKHSCLGSMNVEATSESDSDSVLERPAMLVFCGDFDSMDGPVTIAEKHIDRLIAKRNSTLTKLAAVFTNGIPVRANPPLQVDHSTSAMVTVGRVVGNFSKGMYNHPERGEVVALFCDRVRVLGRENVEKVKDGRWADISIGADLEDGDFNELSITPFPAAGGASLLSKGKNLSEGEPMHEKLKKHLMDSKKMSEEDAEKLSKETVEFSKKKLGFDDEKMSKHLADADDKEMSRMSDEHDEDKKRLAAEDTAKEEKEKEEKAKMAANKEGFTKLALGIRKGNSEVKLEIKKSTIAARLSAFRLAAKVTPAEIKKLDLVKMAGLSEGEIDAAMATFEARQPVLEFGSMVGTSKAEKIEAVTKTYRMARLELETRMNMPSKRAEVAAKMKALDEEHKAKLAAAETAPEEPPSKGMLTKVTHEELCAMVDDKSKHEELKQHLKHMMDHHGLEIPEQSSAHMTALAKKVEEQQTHLEQLIALASPALGITPDEIK